MLTTVIKEIFTILTLRIFTIMLQEDVDVYLRVMCDIL